MAEQTPLDLAERIARIAKSLGIETAVIGAYAMAAHRYVRATNDIDLATATDLPSLSRLQKAVEAEGFHTTLRFPDEEDPLGGVLVVWTQVDDEGDPIEPLDVVNFGNPYRPARTPADRAIRNAAGIEQVPGLRYPQLEDLIALKLYGGGRAAEADVVELLAHNPTADMENIRSVAKGYGFEQIDMLIAEGQELARRRTT